MFFGLSRLERDDGFERDFGSFAVSTDIDGIGVELEPGGFEDDVSEEISLL